MTNFEKFGKDIIVGLIKERGHGIGGINKKNGELMRCDNEDIEVCEKCVFDGECGSEERTRNWLDAEVEWEDEKMTNFEKHKDDIIKTLFTNGGSGIDKKTGELRSCGSLGYCENCQFNGDCGSDTLRKWLDSEYVEPEKEEVDWSKVPIDTPVLVSDDNENWCKRHFAYYRDKHIWVFNNGTTSWTINDLSEVSCWEYGKLLEDE